MVMEKQKDIRSKDNVRKPFKDTEKIDLRNEIQEQYGKKAQPWFSWIFDLIDLPPGSKILELGCGTGSLWEENLSRIPRGWEILISDRSITMVNSARENLRRSRRKLHYLGSDGLQLPFPDESFDAVIAVGLLDLLPDIQAGLEETWRVLKPAGKFIVTAGGKGHLSELESLVSAYLPGDKAVKIGGDESRFGLENGKAWLSRCFKDVVRHDYHDQMVFTNPQPVLDYVLSEQVVTSNMTLEQLGSFVHSIKKRLSQDGSLNVTIRKGAFVAQKTPARPANCFQSG